mmetsp:Transcript_100945/g.231488  ORF Transcript_100945/g.231488 Transcript_100945/m.231488 type:complete len:248 (+) Transcript_100945:229-972(+)
MSSAPTRRAMSIGRSYGKCVVLPWRPPVNSGGDGAAPASKSARTAPMCPLITPQCTGVLCQRSRQSTGVPYTRALFWQLSSTSQSGKTPSRTSTLLARAAQCKTVCKLLDFMVNGALNSNSNFVHFQLTPAATSKGVIPCCCVTVTLAFASSSTWATSRRSPVQATCSGDTCLPFSLPAAAKRRCAGVAVLGRRCDTPASGSTFSANNTRTTVARPMPAARTRTPSTLVSSTPGMHSSPPSSVPGSP